MKSTIDDDGHNTMTRWLATQRREMNTRRDPVAVLYHTCSD
jgi:hypothetical protein